MLFIAWLLNALLCLAAVFLLFYGLLFAAWSWFALVPIGLGVSLLLISFGAGRMIRRRALGTKDASGLGPR
ncbi:hypothetical protein U0C82_01425 [Fulvimarina sp. 2208YS6-2-32]|uniref:Uncharacterized protein n=1 Tax=Fulvimarina uroteuthidis TaxID=3098149 RepID=A0ABU5HXD8_9HYPH|nr:hypothetical protein [Fulvimarina sp. 2208YS6-2-32]